jgi:hypothetical protein
VDLDIHEQLQILKMLEAHFRAYQEAGPTGAHFTSNMKLHLKGIILKPWMLDPDVAFMARAPGVGLAWRKVKKASKNQLEKYRTWWSLHGENFDQWKQEYEEQPGFYFLLCEYFFCCATIYVVVHVVIFYRNLGCSWGRVASLGRV